MLDRPLDQALTGSQIHDVVLVDPRRAEQQRHRVHPLDLRLVLDQLDQVAAVDDRTGGGGHVDADLEAGGVDLRGPASVVTQVAQHVLRAPHQALAAGVEGLPQRRRVAGQRVGRCQCVEDELRGKACLQVPASGQTGRIQQLGDQLAAQQVLLLKQVVQRILGESRVAEPLVAGCRRRRADSVMADHEPGRRAQSCHRTDHQPSVRGRQSRRILDQCGTCGSQRSQERHRVCADERVFRDAQAVQDRPRGRLRTGCWVHGDCLQCCRGARAMALPAGRAQDKLRCCLNIAALDTEQCTAFRHARSGRRQAAPQPGPVSDKYSSR